MVFQEQLSDLVFDDLYFHPPFFTLAVAVPQAGSTGDTAWKLKN